MSAEMTRKLALFSMSRSLQQRSDAGLYPPSYLCDYACWSTTFWRL